MLVENGSHYPPDETGLYYRPRVDSKIRPAYFLPEYGKQKVTEYVHKLVANPGKLIQPSDLDALFAKNLNTRAAVAVLPSGFTEDDFVGVLQLACFTEAATDSYAKIIKGSATRYGQPWLEEFNDLWVLDELSHAAPFKKMLMELGFSEVEVDRGMRAAQNAIFTDGEDYAPDGIASYGMIQEWLTDHYYGRIHGLLKKTSPEAAEADLMIKRRESLHMAWYRKMGVLQVEANPDNIVGIAVAAANFRLPGNQVVPELQSRANYWLPLMGADLKRIQKELSRNVAEMANEQDPRTVGRLVVELAVEKGVSLGRFTPAHLRSALNMLGGPGYGIFGEAALQKYVMGRPIQRSGSVTSKIRSLIVGKVEGMLPDINMITLPPAPKEPSLSKAA